MTTVHANARAAAFLAVGGLAVAGTLVGQLGATSAATYASDGNGGVTSGLFLALFLVTSSVSATWTPRLAARWGGLRCFAWAQLFVAVSWTMVGVIEASTNSSLAVLLVAAPFLGLLSGLTAVLTPFITRSYIDPHSLSSSLAKRSAVSGVAAMIGAVVGGFLIHATDPGIGILANGLLTIPLALFTFLVQPREIPAPVHSSGHPLRDVLVTLRTSKKVRPLLVLAVVQAIFVAPIMMMIVPILKDLDHAPLPSGAGLVLAGGAAGRLLVPYLVSRLLRKRQELAAALSVYPWLVGCMLAFGATALLPLSDFDLVLWTLIGFGLGATRFTIRPLIMTASTKAGAKGDEMAGLTAVITLGVFVSPVGPLVWGFMIEYLTAPVTLVTFALAGITVTGLLAHQLKSAENQNRARS